jgi:hypothetical protein
VAPGTAQLPGKKRLRRRGSEDDATGEVGGGS